MSIEEYWCAGEDDLRDDYEPEFGPGDTVCFKDWPDFTYNVVQIDGDATEVDDCCSAMRIPTAALRKVEGHRDKVRKATREITAAFAEVNQRLRDQ